MNEVKDTAIWLYMYLTDSGRIKYVFISPIILWSQSVLSDQKSDCVRRFALLLPHTHVIIVWCQEASNQGDRDIHRIYRIIVRKDCFLMQGNWGGEYFKVSTTGVQILYLVYPIVFREEGVAEVHGVMDWSTLYLRKSASENQWVLGGWWHTIERTLNAF